MTSDPQVDLIFSHFIPRYEATGVDPNDLRTLMRSITRWEDWCRGWSTEAARHDKLAEEAAAQGRTLTAAEAYVRAAIYYHYGKHLFAEHPEEFREAHDAMLRCYAAGATKLPNPAERVEFPYRGVAMPGWLRKPRGMARPPVAVILPGLDACKEELHAWAEAFVDRGLAALTLDGPGQGETSFALPTTHEWGAVLALARQITLEGKAERITCPLLVVFGAGDRLVPPSEGERLVKAASGPSQLVVYEEGNHVCFDISYKFRPLTGDWIAASAIR